MMGCGGDQNPYPRSKLEFAQQHGRALANGVEAALQADMRLVEGPLSVALDTAVLEMSPAPTHDELVKLQSSSDGYDRRRAEYLLEQLQSNGRINTEYPCPVQVVRFGTSLSLVAIGGETVVDYSLRLKREWEGSAIWVAGYSNDVFAYLPSERVLKEGGYEGGGAMRYSFFPGPFTSTVEQRVFDKIRALSEKTRAEIDRRFR
jgi:hypothetical protein